MALSPLPLIPAAPSAPSAARGVTDAQRAFFQAALGQAAPMVAIDAPETRPAPAPTPEPAMAAAPADAPKTGYRPGSLLDVRI